MGGGAAVQAAHVCRRSNIWTTEVPSQSERSVSTAAAWALTQGAETKFLLNIYYEERWEQDISDFRREFNISLPPTIHKS